MHCRQKRTENKTKCNFQTSNCKHQAIALHPNAIIQCPALQFHVKFVIGILSWNQIKILSMSSYINILAIRLIYHSPCSHVPLLIFHFGFVRVFMNFICNSRMASHTTKTKNNIDLSSVQLPRKSYENSKLWKVFLSVGHLLWYWTLFFCLRMLHTFNEP